MATTHHHYLGQEVKGKNRPFGAQWPFRLAANRWNRGHLAVSPEKGEGAGRYVRSWADVRRSGRGVLTIAGQALFVLGRQPIFAYIGSERGVIGS